MFRFVLLALACLAMAATGSASPVADPAISLTITDKQSGAFSIAANGVEGVRSAPVFVRAHNQTFSSGGGGLVLTSIDTSSGDDALGAFDATRMHYTCAGSGLRFTCAIKMYADATVVFEQHFVDDFPGVHRVKHEIGDNSS